MQCRKIRRRNWYVGWINLYIYDLDLEPRIWALQLSHAHIPLRFLTCAQSLPFLGKGRPLFLYISCSIVQKSAH
jgi:hypothetical protein